MARHKMAKALGSWQRKVSNAVATPAPPPSGNRWLEVRAQFDTYSTQNMDAEMFELRSGVTGSFVSGGPDQTTSTPIPPYAMGEYITGSGGGAYHSTVFNQPTTYPATAMPVPVHGSYAATATTPPPSANVWAELQAGKTSGSPLQAVGSLDVLAFFGPISPGTGYSIAVRGTGTDIPGMGNDTLAIYSGDVNIRLYVRVWSIDPTVFDPILGLTPWPSIGPPPADGSVPAGVVVTGTDPMVTTAPPWGAPAFSSLQDNVLPSVATGATGNGWSIWGMPSSWTGSSQWTHDGVVPWVNGAGMNPRIYHVDPSYGVAGSPGTVPGTFTVL